MTYEDDLIVTANREKYVAIEMIIKHNIIVHLDMDALKIEELKFLLDRERLLKTSMQTALSVFKLDIFFIFQISIIPT